MIFHGPASPGMPYGVPLTSLGATAPAPEVNIKNLQVALKDLAVASGRPAIDPGPVTGIIDTQTRAALTNATSFIAPNLPRAVGTAFALAAGAALFAPSTYDKFIFAQSLTLTGALRIATQKFTGGAGTLPGDDTGLTVATPWYKTGLGIGAIAAGSLLLLFLVMPHAPRAA